MTNNSNNSGWFSASGAVQDSGSNLLNTEASREPQTVVGSGGLEIIGTGPVQRNAPVSYTAGQEAPVDNSIMATVKAPHGGPIMGRSPNGSDIVSIGGMTTHINAAIHAGLLVRNHDGSFSDKVAPDTIKDPTAEAQAKAATKQGKDGAGESAFPLSDDAKQALTKIASTVQPGAAIKAVDSVLMLGGVSDSHLARMASQAGVEPSEMASQVNAAHAGFYDTAVDVIEEAGIDSEAFGKFVEADPVRYRKLTDTARQMVLNNDLTGLRELTSSFYEQADRFMPEETRAALTEAGFGYKESPNGLQVLVSGTQVSFAVAVKQGIIKFSKG